MKLRHGEEWAARVVVPHALRDGILGDWIEERAVIAAEHGEPRARRWIARQIVRSVPAMLRYRLVRGGAGPMRRRLLASALFATCAALQAWDSGVHRSSALVIALVALALVATTAASVLSTRAVSFAATAAAGLVLLGVARALSPVPLRELVLPMVLALPILVQLRAQEIRSRTEPGEPSPPRSA